MLSPICWPDLAVLIKYDKAPYIVSPPQLVEEQCAAGDRSLIGNSLLSARLDMALSGLMAELGQDFFHNDVFPSRLTAAVDILAAARVFLQPQLQPPGQDAQINRVRLLAEEAQAVLEYWIGMNRQDSRQTLLMAAEEAAELS